VSIETFSNMADEIVMPTVLDSHSRAMVLGRINEIQASGATNLFEGLSLAVSRSMAAPATHPVRRVVLISDGRATAGQTSTDVIATLAERGSAMGVQVTAFGVGLDYRSEE